MTSSVLIDVGAVCFGVVVGYIAYRALARSGPTSSVSDLSAVLGAIGGGAVTKAFGSSNVEAFACYSIGLLVGMILYPIVLILFGEKVKKKSDDTVFLGSDPAPE